MRLSILLVLASVVAFPPAAAGDDKKEQDKLQGTWKPVSYEIAGLKLEGDALHDYVVAITIKGDGFVWKMRNDEQPGKLKLDTAKDPKHMDFIFEPEPGVKITGWTGLYMVEGDTLKLCLIPGAGQRPKAFSTKDTTSAVLTLKRTKS